MAQAIQKIALDGGRDTDVITRVVNGHPNGRIDDLMPWAYAEKPILKAMV